MALFYLHNALVIKDGSKIWSFFCPRRNAILTQWQVKLSQVWPTININVNIYDTKQLLLYLLLDIVHSSI